MRAFTDLQTPDWVCEPGAGQGKLPAKPGFSEHMAPALPPALLPFLPRPGRP